MKERSLFANSASGMIAQGLRGVLSVFFVAIVVARIGLTGYGLFTVISLFSFYLGILGQLDLGYPSFLINFISRHSKQGLGDAVISRAGSFLSYLLTANVLLGCLCFAGSEILVGLFKIDTALAHDFKVALFLIILANFFSAFFQMCSVIWIASHQNVELKKLETGSYFFFTVLASGAVNVFPRIQSVAAAFLVSQIVLSSLVFLKTVRHFKISMMPRLSGTRLIRDDWTDWKPFLFFRVNGFAQRQSDVTIISLLLGPQVVAAYDISMKIPSLLKSLLGRISEILAPFASQRMAYGDFDFVKRLSERLVSVQIALGVFLTIDVFFFGGDICAVWLGENQRTLAPSFFVASLISLVVPPYSVLMTILAARNQRQRQLVFWPTLISILNIVMTIPITARWGIQGTLSLTVAQFATVSAFAVYWSRLDFGFSMRSSFATAFKVAVASAAGCALALGVKLALGRNFIDAEVIAVQVLLVGLMLLVLKPDLQETRSLMRRKASAA